MEEGKEKKGGNWKEEERFGSDDEEEKAFGLDDNEGVSPTFIRQSGKPSPASSSEITTVCLQDELEEDGSQVKLKSRIMARRFQNLMEITDACFILHFLFSVIFYGGYAPPSLSQLSMLRGNRRDLWFVQD